MGHGWEACPVRDWLWETPKKKITKDPQKSWDLFEKRITKGLLKSWEIFQHLRQPAFLECH
jgi:hypothetical protein